MDDDKRPGPAARSLLADRTDDVLASMASLWEIALKTQAGKPSADIQGTSDTPGRNGVILLEVGVAHLATLTGLPRRHLGLLDHLPIAQAIAENATLMSEDRWMPSDPVPVINCSA